MTQKGRVNRNERSPGERNGRAKLTNQQVINIKKEHTLGNITQVALAKKYGVSRSAIQRIQLGKAWTTLKTVPV